MSFTPAHVVTSTQTDIHTQLNNMVYKHFNVPYLKPIAEHNRQAFLQAHHHWQAQGGRPILLDSGCGTGQSSRTLAKSHPEYFVIGVDQSQKRLQHKDNEKLPDNCMLVRAECSDFWRLIQQHQWPIAQHTLFYPNPYPKTKHLQRRWHGHSIFPTLLSISPHLTLRTNWEIYAKEFYHAATLSQAFDHTHLQAFLPKQPITAFERKYIKSGHQLWQVILKKHNNKEGAKSIDLIDPAGTQ